MHLFEAALTDVEADTLQMVDWMFHLTIHLPLGNDTIVDHEIKIDKNYEPTLISDDICTKFHLDHDVMCSRIENEINRLVAIETLAHTESIAEELQKTREISIVSHNKQRDDNKKLKAKIIQAKNIIDSYNRRLAKYKQTDTELKNKESVGQEHKEQLKQLQQKLKLKSEEEEAREGAIQLLAEVREEEMADLKKQLEQAEILRHQANAETSEAVEAATAQMTEILQSSSSEHRRKMIELEKRLKEAEKYVPDPVQTELDELHKSLLKVKLERQQVQEAMVGLGKDKNQKHEEMEEKYTILLKEAKKDKTNALQEQQMALKKQHHDAMHSMKSAFEATAAAQEQVWKGKERDTVAQQVRTAEEKMKSVLTKIDMYRQQVKETRNECATIKLRSQQDEKKAEEVLKKFRQESQELVGRERSARKECDTRLERAMEAITLFEHKVNKQEQDIQEERTQWNMEKLRMSDRLEQHGKEVELERRTLSEKMSQLERDTVLRERRVDQLESALKSATEKEQIAARQRDTALQNLDEVQLRQDAAVKEAVQVSVTSAVHDVQGQHAEEIKTVRETLRQVESQRDDTLNVCTDMKDRLNDAVRARDVEKNARERMSEEQSRERIVRMERERQQEELQGKLQRQLNEQLVLKEQLEKEEKEKHHSLFLLQQQFDQEKNKWEQEKKQQKKKEKEAAALRLEESLQQLRVSFLDKCEKEKEQLRHTLIETLREKETDHERSITSSMAMFKQEIEELKMTATTAISSQKSAEEQTERQQELSKEKLQTAVHQMEQEHQSTLKKMEQRKETEREAMSVRHSQRVQALEVDIAKCKIETETATAMLETVKVKMRNELTTELAMEKEKTLAAKNALIVLQKEQVKERAAHQVDTDTHQKGHAQEIQRMVDQHQQVVAQTVAQAVAQAVEDEKSKDISRGVRSMETMKDALEKQKLEMENKERVTLQTILQEQQEKERLNTEAKARHAASIALLEQEGNKERDQRNQLLSQLSQVQAEHSSQVKKLQLEMKHEQEKVMEQQAKAMVNKKSEMQDMESKHQLKLTRVRNTWMKETDGRLQQLRSAAEEGTRASLVKLQEMHDSAVKKLEHQIQNLSFQLQSAESQQTEQQQQTTHTKIQLTNDLSTAQERCQYQEERIMLLEASLEEHSTRPIADVAEVRAAAEEEIKGQSTRLRAQKAHQEQYTREKEEWTKTRLVKQEQIMQHQASIQKLKLQHQDALKIALKKQQQQATSSKKIMQQQIEQQKVEFINLSKMLLKEKKHRDHERKRHAADLRVYKDEIKEEEAQHKIEIEKLSLLSIPKESIDIKIIKDKTMKKTRNRTINKEGNQSATQTRRLKSNNYKFGLQQSCVSSLKKKVAVEILIHNEQLSTKAATKSTAAESHPLNIYQLASSPLSTHRHSPRRRPPPRPHPPCSTVWNSDWYLSQPSTSQPIDELINKCF